MKFGALTILALAALLATAAAAAPRDTVFKDDRTLGNPKAPVTVIEYLAPTCPHCARFAASVFPEIKKNYIDTGKVLYVIRIFPLLPADGGVAGLAAAAGLATSAAGAVLWLAATAGCAGAVAGAASRLECNH